MCCAGIQYTNKHATTHTAATYPATPVNIGERAVTGFRASRSDNAHKYSTGFARP